MPMLEFLRGSKLNNKLDSDVLGQPKKEKHPWHSFLPGSKTREDQDSDEGSSRRQRPTIDLKASVNVSNQGNTFNITGQSTVHFEYGSKFNYQTAQYTLHLVIQSLIRSYNVEYDMVANTTRGPCTPETRVTILNELVDWCNSDSMTLYWMNGMAGTGKTTIMYSLCLLLAQANLLGASFFCSRSLPDCRDPNLIIPTIAFQLSKKYRPFAEALAEALQKDEGILHRGLEVQLRELLVNPWNAKKSELPTHAVIVLDAVDECNDGHTAFLQAISNYAGKLPFKMIMTSRPEPSTRLVLITKDQETLTTFILHEMEESLVEEDIVRYVESQLKKCLPSLSPSDVLQLSKQCGKFFIYAATVCRFIMEADGDHLKRFLSLLSLSPSDARGRAIQPIDALYVEILRQVLSSKKLPSEIDDIKLVFHTVVCAREPLTRDVIGSLLELTIEEVESQLKSLHSLIFVPQAIDQPISTFHASLPDFMMDISRSGEFYWFMRRALHQNICHLDGQPSNDTIDEDIIRTYIPLGLRYACVYWQEHWTLSDVAGRRVALGLLDEFLTTNILHWFECLSLTKTLAVGIEGLENVQYTLIEDTSLASITHDYLRFIQQVYDLVVYNAMEIYSNALVWIPSQSPLRTHHSSLCEQTPQVLCGLPTIWTGPDQVINIHSDTIYSIAISQDGRYIISGSADKTVRVWNVRSHTEECALSGHTDEINSVAISGDGSRAVSGSDDGNVLVWNIATREAVLTLESHGRVWAVAMSPVGNWIASGHKDSVVHVWNGADGHLVHSLRGHTDWVLSVVFTPDGKWLISGSRDNTARIWNTKTGKAEYILHGHTELVQSVACSPDGEKIITGSYDNTARLWNISGKELLILQGHSHNVNCVAFMPNGERVVTGSDDKTLRVWDVASGDTVHVFTRLAYIVRSVAVFPDGLKMASSSGKTISIWSLRGGDTISEEEKIKDVSLPNVKAKSMAFSANGRRVLLLPSLRILDTATLEEKVVLGSDGIGYSRGALSTSGSRVAASEMELIKVWELTGDDIVANHFTLQGHTGDIKSVSFSQDERQLVSASDDRTARVWDVTTGNRIHTLNHPSWVYSATFSHNNTQIISAAWTTVHVWYTQSGEQLRQFDADAPSVAFSPDDRHIITSYNGAISIHKANTLRLEHIHEGYRYWTTMSDGSFHALSDDGQWICHFPRFSDQPRRLLWIPSQYRPTITDEFALAPFASGPLFTSTPLGVQVCLPRKDGLVTLILPQDA